MHAFLTDAGDEVLRVEHPIDATFVRAHLIDFIVSYGYKHIIRPEVLVAVGRRAVNLHISLLPWNRGYHPNVWSFLEDTPKGVTIHVIDEGVDTGEILVQDSVTFGHGETLSSSYALLSERIEQLFRSNWDAIKAGELTSRPQEGEGSCHREADLTDYEHVLSNGWNTPVAEIQGMAMRERSS
ncbi:MAG: formyltransferase family protein [Coriobacteriia bacterium]|nr:formyltransferase family protein [Coriobacteriia bacterium]